MPTLLILGNTVTLAMDRSPISRAEANALEVCNFAFTVAFTLEMLFKLRLLGPVDYLKDRFNVFDGARSCSSSLVELAAGVAADVAARVGGRRQGRAAAARSRCCAACGSSASSSSRASGSRCTCCSRALAMTTFNDMWPRAVLLFLFMYIFALVGMQFFANRLRFDADGYPVEIGTDGWAALRSARLSFDTFGAAMTTVFTVLTGENWNFVMYDAWRGTSWLAALYFVLLIILGIFLLMNLFLAILLNNFSGVMEKALDDAEAAAAADHSTLPSGDELVVGSTRG